METPHTFALVSMCMIYALPIHAFIEATIIILCNKSGIMLLHVLHVQYVETCLFTGRLNLKRRRFLKGNWQTEIDSSLVNENVDVVCVDHVN